MSVNNQPWMSDPKRNCAQSNPEDWFPREAMQRRFARKLCGLDEDPDSNPCPVATQCLAYALESGEEFGVWGGTTEEERRRLRREAVA